MESLNCPQRIVYKNYIICALNNKLISLRPTISLWNYIYSKYLDKTLGSDNECKNLYRNISFEQTTAM